MTTRSAGNFTRIVPDAHTSADLFSYVVDALGAYGADFDTEGLLDAYCEALNAKLPEDARLARNGELYCPVDDVDAARDALVSAVEDVDFFELAQQYDRAEGNTP